MIIINNYIDYINENFFKDGVIKHEEPELGFYVDYIQGQDISKLLNLKYEYFASSYNYNKRLHNKYNKNNTDWSISKKLMHNKKIIGGYFLQSLTLEDTFLDLNNKDESKRVTLNDLNSDKWINNNVFYDIRPLYGKNGVQGVSLFIDKNYRYLKLGQLLIDSVINDKNIDYMFGYAYHTLNNINSWMKRRYLIKDVENFDKKENYDYSYYMTLETKNIKLTMTELGEKYKSEHTKLNFK